MATQPLILTELRSVTNTNIVIGNREQSYGSLTIILSSPWMTRCLFILGGLAEMINNFDDS